VARVGAGYWPRGCIHGNFLIVSTDFQFCRGCIGTHCCLRSFAPGRKAEQVDLGAEVEVAAELGAGLEGRRGGEA